LSRGAMVRFSHVEPRGAVSDCAWGGQQPPNPSPNKIQSTFGSPLPPLPGMTPLSSF